MGEKKEIRISVKDKIACLVDKEQFLVCGNNDYEVVFDFDSDWEGINTKTAVFVYGKNPVHQPFVGNVCQGVAVENATLCAIGVFAGNIKTTTGATIECKPSIRDLGGVPKPPSKEVYDEIMALLDKAIEAHTELPTGGKKGQVLKKVSDKDYDTAWENDEQRDLTEIEESLANKLDKTDEANKIYGTDAEGNQKDYPISDRNGGGVVLRESDGQILVPSVPTRGTAAASKGYVDTKVAQTTTPSRLYGTNANGAQTLHQFSQSVIPWFIATRSERGELFVPYTPYADSEATSKRYVDGLVNPLEERVSDLESLTLTFTEDKAVAYNKSVPASVGKYARIKSIGGASKASDNICDPRTLTSNGEITVNADNSITFGVEAGGITAINLPPLPKGTYYWVVETNTNITVNPYTSEGVATNNPFEITSDTDNFYFEFENIDWSGGETKPVTVTAKIAVFKGSTKRGYVPFFSGFKNAEVSKIESRGANLIPFPYVFANKVMNVGYKETVSGVTFEVLENGLISAIGTPTSAITYWIWRANMPSGNYYIGSKFPSGGILIANYNNLNNGCGAVNTKFTHNGGVLGMYISISSGVTINSVFSPMLTKDVYVADFKPYKAEPIDTFTIPVEAIKARVNGFGLDKNYIRCIDGKFEFVQMKKKAILNSKIGYWQSYPYQTVKGAYVYYNNAISGKKIGYDTSNCSAFEYLQGSWGEGNVGQYSDHPSNANIYFCSDLSTLAEFTAWLDAKESSGNPVILEYDLTSPIVTDITDLFTNGYKIQVESGGTLIPVNDNKLPVPTNIAYVTRKG